ncbi:MAG TPA: DNA-binding protein [Acidobacteriota bacterium]|nr:DNA-binding protein [Acidobacteriota bacterium]
MEIRLTDEQKRELESMADRLKVKPADLATSAIRDFLGRMDSNFESAADHVLKKNRELYRRLS